MAPTTIQNGEIRHVTRNPDVIVKVAGPFSGETFEETGNTTKLDLYILTNEFLKYHYVVILGLVDSYTAPGNKFYIAKLITHSSRYDNLEINKDLYDKSSTSISLTNSYITRDKFLIPEAEVRTNKIYGKFHLDILNEASEY
ncbi:hypothetical protein PBT90_06070 [Algoriphagus halophytocola]|uniref:hypothetical protein n=1 Tax=Algoriphagus halophytocola TaxID=2991499 RepID=UPI0022DE5ED8|nr:hypothetical protein [Algoriphagus sp. TR-M9]WBL44253.1 hypothetical protein PBT90_06070 [Algoriphagus sp. TR-M9]